MAVTRREMIGGALAAGAHGLAPRWVRAEVALGTATVTTLSDGSLVLPAAFLFGTMPQAELAPILARAGISGATVATPLNVTLLRDGDRTVLFDCGSGPAFQDTAGRLAAALEELALDPAEVTHVVFTHGHPDHLWGVLDDFDEPVFANAAFLMGRIERDFWLDPATVDSVGAERATFAVGAARRLETLGDRIAVFEDGAEILPGIAALHTPGHTPGHMAFEIRSGTEGLVVLGDAVTNAHVGFERPDWPSGSDQDPAAGAATRRALLDRVAGLRVSGYHLPGGGIGRVERDGEAYRFVAES